MRTRSLELDLAHPTLEFGMGVPIYFFAGPSAAVEFLFFFWTQKKKRTGLRILSANGFGTLDLVI